jgi:hypothetical protein
MSAQTPNTTAVVRRILVLFFACMAFAPFATAQTHICDPLDTIATCRAHIVDRLTANSQKAVVADQAETKKKTETGLADLATGLSSSVKDFLPLLQLSGNLGMATTNDNTGIVTVALSKPDTVQLQALIETIPTLFDPIKSALPKTGRDAIEKDLLATPDRTNVTLQLSYNVSSDRLGRDFKNQQPLLEDLFGVMIGSTSRTAADEQKVIRANTELDRLFRTADAGTLDVNDNTRMIAIADRQGMNAEARQFAIEQALVQVESAILGLAATFGGDFKASGLPLFGQLVINQNRRIRAVGMVLEHPRGKG